MKKGPSLCGAGIGTASHQSGNVYLLGTFSGMEITVMGMLFFPVHYTFRSLNLGRVLTLEARAMAQ